MPSNIKLLKFGLPIATTTTAAIATIYLVAASRKDQEKKIDEDALLDNLELVTEKFEEEIKVEQGDESEKTQDSEGESSSEKTQKVKNLLQKEISKEHKEKIINELLTNADELAKRITKDSDVTVTAEELKKIASKELGIQLDKAGSENPAVSKETEEHALNSEEGMQVPLEEGSESRPDSSLNEPSPEGSKEGEQELLSQEVQGKSKELEKSQKEDESSKEATVPEPETGEQLDNGGVAKLGDLGESLEKAPAGTSKQEDDAESLEETIEESGEGKTSQGEPTDQVIEDSLRGEEDPNSKMEGESDEIADSEEGANRDGDGVLNEDGQKSELDRAQQLAELTGWKGKIEDVLSRFSGRFKFR